MQVQLFMYDISVMNRPLYAKIKVLLHITLITCDYDREIFI